MYPLSRRIALFMLLSTAAGCSAAGDAGNPAGGWFGGDSTLHTITGQKPAGDSAKPAIRYAATLHISRYADLREQRDPRLLGTSTQRVRGVSGSQLLLDQEIADLVTSAIKTQFDAEGYQVLEDGSAGDAVFEVSGAIKDLTLNVKHRDEVNIEIETTVKDMRSGAVVWSGLVTEKQDRFAGVSGNNKNDVVAYLNKELRVAGNKMVAAVSASLMAAYPALFNLTPGTQAIPGVSVYAATAATGPASAVPATIMPSAGAQPGSMVSAGLLLVNTSPPRAKVYLDGVYYGLSPLRAEMEPGVHAVEVKLKGYQTVTEKVSVRKGDNTEMELNLER
ncbi:MAG: hypothetical protein A3J49_19750 [Gallionellales bacterium RIFCSPHIGHO2_02_FULL_57_16]|nr:MAG: hypothetical protein A3J49_19750 [Gallionellales bacterium RIFCSPHIGHO2_02_FULL_57_16]